MSAATLPGMLRRGLLWLWRVLPLTGAMRWTCLWIINRKFLLGVMAVAFDDQDRVLVLHHTYRRDHPWGLPGGWLGAGEEPDQGALRELREETGFEGRIDALLWVGGGVPRSEVGIGYLVTITGGQFRANAEVDAHVFVPVDALPLDMVPFQREIALMAAARRREDQSSRAR
jgi:8-oxo-dGTP diphosphatase